MIRRCCFGGEAAEAAGCKERTRKNMADDKYAKIIDLPHHVSKTRRQMPMSDRAAQFAPFAALTGYGDAIKETGRTVTERMEHVSGYEAEDESEWLDE